MNYAVHYLHKTVNLLSLPTVSISAPPLIKIAGTPQAACAPRMQFEGNPMLLAPMVKIADSVSVSAPALTKIEGRLTLFAWK